MVVDPMITIKKADGTFAKVPLSEFKKIQAAAKNVGQPTHTHSRLPQRARSSILGNRDKRGIEESPKPAHHQPAHHDKKSTINNIQYPISNKPHHVKSMSRADAGSPLEEKLKVKTSAPLFSPKREKQVEEVLGKLGFSVVPDVLGRLKSLVLAKLKDIKSEDETRELLSRSIKNGGLGLTESQVDKIIMACREVEGLENIDDANVPALKGNAGGMALMVEPPELPMVISSSPPFQGGVRGGLPSIATNTSATTSSLPPTAVRRGPAEAAIGKGEMTIAKMINESSANEPIFKLDTRPVMKQSMQDVTASAIEMGPTEEIESTTLTDFRRLSGNPEEAARRLQQKMFNLQDESFVLYLAALDAYHASSLYSEYMRAICQSLAERKSLANVLTIQNGIKLNEAMALMEMERSL